MSAFNHAWSVIKGMNPMDDPRIRRHIGPNDVHGFASFKAREPFDPNNVIVDQEVTRMGRPAPDLRNRELDIRHRRSYGVPETGELPLLSDELDRIRVPTRDRDRDLVKALSTEDLRMAARTGGIQMTPERRRAYADAGLPLSTGGGFRTMPESTARNLIDLQRGRGSFLSEADFNAAHDLKHKDTLDALHTYGGYYSPRYGEFTANPGDEGLEDIHYALTQGQSMKDPSLEQEPERIGRNKRLEGQNVFAREYDFVREVPQPRKNFYGDRLHQELASGATVDSRGRRGVVPMEIKNRLRSRGIPITTPRLFPGEYADRNVQEIRDNTPDRFREHLDKILAERRRAEEEQYPTSEFSRRGEAGASPSDQAFKIIQQRKDNAERMKQVQADRQREMMMQRQRDKMKSRTPPRARGGRREGPNQRKMRLKREAERRKNR